MSKQSFLKFCVVAAWFLFIPAMASAARPVKPPPTSGTWYVSAAKGSDRNSGDSAKKPFASIVQAVSVAKSGDSIEVAEGTYRENVVVNAFTNLSIRGGWNTAFTVNDPAALETLLYGAGVGDGFSCTGNNGLVIDGFSIRNFGRGIYLIDTDYTRVTLNVKRCTISNCTSGVFMDLGSVAVSQSDITYCVRGIESLAGSYYNGAYAWRLYNVDRNLIAYNSDSGIYVTGVEPTGYQTRFTNNVFHHNTNYNLLNLEAVHPYIYHNTIDGGMYGIGVFVSGIWSLYGDIINNIVVNTQSAFRTRTSTSSFNAFNIATNCMNGNGINYEGYFVNYSYPPPGSSDLNVDPILDANYHLTASSPVIDAGTPLSWIDYDFDGDPRTLGVGGDGLNDIGADEYR